MKELNLNFPSENIKGEPQEATYGEVLASYLYNQAKGKDAEQSFRLYDWAVELNKGHTIALYKADAEMLYNVVEALPMPNGALVPILRKIKNVIKELEK